MRCVTSPKTRSPMKLGMLKVSSPESPNWVVNWTEKNSPRPHNQERATVFPQSIVLNQRGRGEEAMEFP